MAFTVVIPARLASTRLPNKPLLDIAGRPMIAHVVAQAQQSSAQRIIVAVDNIKTAEVLAEYDCEVCMTREDHFSGSDRIVEVIEKMDIADHEIIVNVQGDEPLIPVKLIDEVASHLIQDSNQNMATAAHAITAVDDIDNPNVVKVVLAKDNKALYFSRCAIPYSRNNRQQAVWRHIGVYAYRSHFLKKYNQWPSSPLEQTESLEQLRVLENGYSIAVHTVNYDTGIGVDTEEDLQHVRDVFSKSIDAHKLG